MQVGRGQKLGDTNGSLEFADMTVEDLLHIIRNLSPEESAVAAVSRGLYYLDSRALAALLKELHKAGLSSRCGLSACSYARFRSTDASMSLCCHSSVICHVTCLTHIHGQASWSAYNIIHLIVKRAWIRTLHASASMALRMALRRHVFA